MFILNTICTAKYSPRGEFETIDRQTKRFNTMTEVNRYISETYGNCKRDTMYIDTKDKKQKAVGYVFCFRNRDYSHNSKSWIQHDWVDLEETKQIILTLK